ncbi:MAG: ATP-binding protein [Pseudomonadota bacterium]
MQNIEVQVENDHIERITTAKPLVALSELIWNAYDADAKNVRVQLQKGRLSKLGLIRVIDDGTGIAFDDVGDFFSRLGGSWKQSKPKTDGGRFIHGEKGQGRFKAFALGDQVRWRSASNGRSFLVSASKSDLKNFRISDPEKTERTGCTVEIDGIARDFEIWAEDGFAAQIRDVFALQLYEDAEFSIVYDGEEIDARDAIANVQPYELTVEIEPGKSFEATLELVEWRRDVERKLMLCLPGRFSFYEMQPGIHARGFNFTAYLTSEYFQKLVDDNTETLAELDTVSTALIDAAKYRMRQHFREREAERSRGRIQEWKDAKIYPYEGQADDPIEVNERQVFDVVALNLADYSSDFEKAPDKQKKLILQLVKAAVETGPSNLLSILEQVVDLPDARQEELADLLRKTSLTSVINAAKAVTDRLEFLRALQILIFDSTSKKQLLERSQLHRIIAQETWIFGEQFNLASDDQDLTAVLKAHIKLLGKEREKLAPTEPVLDADGRAAIVDLMLSARLPTATDEQRRHLVVELKRPSQPINEDVISQIKKYAKAVALDHRFKQSDVEWDFVAVSNSFTQDAELEARQSKLPRGMLLELDEPNIRVWAKTWGELIQEAEGRLTFYKKRLQYQATDEEALRYLRSIDADYLSDEVKARIAEMDDRA